MTGKNKRSPQARGEGRPPEGGTAGQAAPAGRTGEGGPGAPPGLVRLAEEVKALGLDRDGSVDLLVARLAQLCAGSLATPAGAEAPGPGDLGALLTCPPEVGTLAAAKVLGVSKDTVLKLREAGVLPYRNAAPPGSSRPVFRFPLDAVLKLRGGYRTEVPAPRGPKAPPRRRAAGGRKYNHLNLGDD